MTDLSHSLFEVHITLGFKSEVSTFISFLFGYDLLRERDPSRTSCKQDLDQDLRYRKVNRS